MAQMALIIVVAWGGGGGGEVAWGCAMVAVIDFIILAATMDLQSNVDRLPLSPENRPSEKHGKWKTHIERCSSHPRPTTTKTHKGQIRDPQCQGRNPRRGSRIFPSWVFAFGWFFCFLNFYFFCCCCCCWWWWWWWCCRVDDGDGLMREKLR